ncbi:hypothetical protein E4T48_01186 [Aureobasidium sp. EXF-10727]|nr:hypothetical protein E4T48_01186 [Aureobasidium sp. EXF-10727]
MSSLSPSPTPSTSPKERVPRALGTFFNDKTFSDIRVKFGDQEIFAHKLVLVKSSIWFETAILGEFKASRSIRLNGPVIDLGNDDDPALVSAMLQFFYHGHYGLYESGPASESQHLTMYRLADFYDASALRKEASRRLIHYLKECLESWDNLPKYWPPEHVIRSIQQILGPGADEFADNSIQEDIFTFTTNNAGHLYKSVLFQELLVDGSLLNESFGRRFAQKTGELITRLSSSSPRSYVGRWDPSPSQPYSWECPDADVQW